MRNVPGITLQAGEGGGASGTAGDMFNMRGFSAANSLFVDNVRDDGLITRDVFNLEQVEVYLGPTGSDVGRGNAAGYVNMTTKTPRLGIDLQRHGQLRHRREQPPHRRRQRPRADGRSGKLAVGSAVRLNALWQDGGVAGRDYAENERKAIAPSDRARPRHADARHCLGSVHAAGQPAGLRHSRRRLGRAADADLDADDAAGRSGELLRLGRTSTTTTAEQNSVTGRIEHDFGRDWSVRNQTRYNETTRDAVITAIQISRQLRAGHRDGRLQPPGQLPRELRSWPTRRR